VQFDELSVPGCFAITWDRRGDERGWFARTFAVEEMAARGLVTDIVHCNLSFNPIKGTLRGLHYQLDPWGEAKLIRCSRGRMWDVLVDVRPDSPAYGTWVGVELDQDEPVTLYAPIGVAQGFITLRDDTEVTYQMSQRYVADAAVGYRWNDPVLAIDWPAQPIVMNERDQQFPDFVR
jgi:dTDP-4-dehydrorhamnose 3,5-epimerase